MVPFLFHLMNLSSVWSFGSPFWGASSWFGRPSSQRLRFLVQWYVFSSAFRGITLFSSASLFWKLSSVTVHGSSFLMDALEVEFSSNYHVSSVPRYWPATIPYPSLIHILWPPYPWIIQQCIVFISKGIWPGGYVSSLVFWFWIVIRHYYLISMK